ncbi:MAG TPA: TonB family protein [Methylomirabilota bacterium]|jgi:protein TonB|nr:TonB family protein [Methylomirabilota bacterium]
MMSVSVAGRYPARSRLDPALRRQRSTAPPHRLPLVAIGISAVGHALFVLLAVAVVLWNGWHPSKVYVVNLVPAVAAVGNPAAPSQSLPTRPTPPLPSRAPAPAPTPQPRERPIREMPRLPEPAASSPALPSRSAAVRPGDKELPPLAQPTTTQRVDRPEKVDRPVESRPAPPVARGLPTGSPSGAGALSLDASDFPYAWYLRQVVQKIEVAWERQNQLKEPNQKPWVVFEIQRDGSVRTPKIDKTSGNLLYDQAALRAIVEASPFPPLPEGWPKPSLVIGMSFELGQKRS